MAAWGARVAVFHLTEDEAIGLYRYRSSLFGQMAADSTAGALCSLGAFADEESLESINLADAGSIMRRTGRSFGRYHEGRQPWVPPVDLARISHTGGIGAARPEQGEERASATGDVQRQEAVVVVVAVEGPALLAAVHLVVGRVDVQHQP